MYNINFGNENSINVVEWLIYPFIVGVLLIVIEVGLKLFDSRKKEPRVSHIGSLSNIHPKYKNEFTPFNFMEDSYIVNQNMGLDFRIENTNKRYALTIKSIVIQINQFSKYTGVPNNYIELTSAGGKGGGVSANVYQVELDTKK